MRGARVLILTLTLALASPGGPPESRGDEPSRAFGVATRPAQAPRPFPDAARRGDRASSATQPARAASPTGVSMSRMFVALAIVLAIIGGLYPIVRRIYGRGVGGASSRAVKLLSRTPLAPRQQVLLLQVGQRVVVVGESNGTLSTLTQISEPDEVAQLLGQIRGEQMERAASFGSVFRRNQTTFDDPPAAHRPAADEPPLTDEASQATELNQHKSELAGLLEKVRALKGQIGR